MTTIATWTRREKLLASAVTACAAAAGLAPLFHAPWLASAGLVVAAASGIATLVVIWQRSRVEGRTEQKARRRGLRVAIGPVSQIAPTAIGVDAAVQHVLEGGPVPAYLKRAIDEDLRSAIANGLEDTGPWVIIVQGRSKTGKTRCLFEALQASGDGTPLLLVAPVTFDNLKVLLDDPPKLSAPAVLWLDDIEPFLNQGLTFPILEEWHSGGRGRIVAATFGGKGSELIAESNRRTVRSGADVLRPYAAWFNLSDGRSAEIDSLPDLVPEEELATIERYGLAAYLVAAQLLETKLFTEGEESDGTVGAAGVAIVKAAAAWSLCGRTDPIPDKMLRSLWAALPAPELDFTDHEFEDGLSWARKRVAGTISLLEHHPTGYRAYDYVTRLISDAPGSGAPPDAAWDLVIASSTGGEAVGVAVSAIDFGKQGLARKALRQAYETADTPEFASLAGYWLAWGLAVDDPATAIAVSDEVIARFCESHRPFVRVQVARAHLSKAAALRTLNRREDAISVYRRLISGFAADRSPDIGDAVADAILEVSDVFKETGWTEANLDAYDDLVRPFDSNSAPKIREKVAASLYNRGIALAKLSRPEQAFDTWGALEERFADDSTPAAREWVAKALCWKANTLHELRRTEEALAVYDKLTRRFIDESVPAIREVVVNGLAFKCSMLMDLGQTDEELVTYETMMAHYSDDPEPAIRRQVAHALFNKGTRLGHLHRKSEAIETYSEVVRRFADDPQPDVREQVAKALCNRARERWPASPEEARADLEEVMTRFADDDTEVIGNVVTAARQAIERMWPHLAPAAD